MNAEIISVGTELLLGNSTNTDARDVSRALAEIGVNVYWHTVVGDNPARLTECLYRARNRADLIVTTGGLGPTCDDLTKQTVARAFGRELYFDQEAMDTIAAWFGDQGRTFPDNNRAQAWLPEGSTVMANSCGTAPGCIFEENGVVVTVAAPALGFGRSLKGALSRSGFATHLIAAGSSATTFAAAISAFSPA